MKAILLFAMLPLAAQAQLTLYAVNGTAETSIGSSYQLGQVALGSTSSVQFRIYNVGSTSVKVNVTLGGAGFAFTSPLLPYTIPPNSSVSQTLNITVSFTAASTANYSANLQINSLSVILLASGVTAPTLTSLDACSTNVPFNFGSVKVGKSQPCTFSLQNLNPQAITVPSVVVNGLGFTGPNGIATPLTLQAGQSATFSIAFAPPAALVYTGTLSMGTQIFALTGIGQAPILPTPALQFDSGAAASAQQRVLTMTIPGASPITATGYVNLTFAPSTAVVKDDSAVMFVANSSRTIPFSVSAGATNVLLNGQSSATFQTGTTEGTITFTVTTAFGLAGDPTTKLTIPGASVIIDSSSASKERLGWLDIAVAGADNTYSAGAMSFSFFDTSGNAIGGVFSPDFTSTFRNFYAGQSAGSGFKVVVSFPVTGSAAAIGSVKVTLTNAAGVANTGSLTFQ